MSTPAPTPFYTSAGVESLLKTDKPTAAEVLLEKLQGTAADPERIGAEYLPEVLPVSQIQLIDVGVDSAPPRSLTGGASDYALVMHDGETPGGIQFDILRAANSAINARAYVTEEQINAGYVRVSLANFLIQPSQNQIGNSFAVVGNIFLITNGSVAHSTNPSVCFANSAADLRSSTEGGWYIQIHRASSVNYHNTRCKINGRFKISEGTGGNSGRSFFDTQTTEGLVQTTQYSEYGGNPLNIQQHFINPLKFHGLFDAQEIFDSSEPVLGEIYLSVRQQAGNVGNMEVFLENLSIFPL